jgi:hypothetical protein
MSEALGAEGRAEIREAADTALQTAPAPADPQDWRPQAQRRHYTFRLVLLADLESNPDASIVAIRAGDIEATHSIDVAKRLLAAGRAAEALEWLDKPQRRSDTNDAFRTESRIEALDRKPEAALRALPERRALRAYLRWLPDLEDFES